MSRPNKCIKDENGNDVWISRSNVVIPVVFKMNEETGDIFTLVEKRGSAVSHTGEWCCPCGYIDWDETLEEACHREVKEETGLDLDMDKIIFVNVDTNIHTKNQTIDHWYMCWANGKDFDIPLQVIAGTAGGTNTNSIQMMSDNCATTLLSIPCRYMHSGTHEMVNKSDIEACGRLIGEFINHITPEKYI